MAEISDAQLLADLRDALGTPLVRPDDACLAQLHETLAELEREAAPTPITAAARHGHPTPHSVSRVRATRSSVLVASALAAVLTAGVAAAAVVTDTLPGPTRSFAYDLGLPVTSPGLFNAQNLEAQLRQSIAKYDGRQSRRLGQQLIGAMKTLDNSDLNAIRASADTLLVEVGLGLPTVSPTSPSPVTTPVTIPSVIGTNSKNTSVSVPGVSVPSVSTPGITTPSVSVPGAVTVPNGSIPTVTTPSVSIPQVTVPTITVPPITVPKIKLPGHAPL